MKGAPKADGGKEIERRIFSHLFNLRLHWTNRAEANWYIRETTDRQYTVLLHNSGFCNGCITQQYLNSTTNMSYKVLFHNCSMIEMKVVKDFVFLSGSGNISFL
jgi:hypothetical protein